MRKLRDLRSEVTGAFKTKGQPLKSYIKDNPNSGPMSTVHNALKGEFLGPKTKATREKLLKTALKDLKAATARIEKALAQEGK